MRRALTAAVAIVMGLSAVLTLLLTAVEVVAFDEARYARAYEETGRAEDIGISQAELMSVTRHLLGYLKGTQADLNVQATIGGVERPVFNDRELQHMADVQLLFRGGFNLRNVCLVVCLLAVVALWLLERRWTLAFPGGYLVAVGIMLLLLALFGIAAAIDFNGLFLRFHELAFTNDLWLLDPRTDVLIQMYPEVFFNDMALAIVRTIAVFLLIPAVLAIINVVCLRRRKKKGDSTP
jgi:integral membrane protein (TIGR01906 family)